MKKTITIIFLCLVCLTIQAQNKKGEEKIHFLKKISRSPIILEGETHKIGEPFFAEIAEPELVSKMQNYHSAKPIIRRVKSSYYLKNKSRYIASALRPSLCSTKH